MVWVLAPVVTELLPFHTIRLLVAGGVGAGARCDYIQPLLVAEVVAGGVGAGARCDLQVGPSASH